MGLKLRHDGFKPTNSLEWRSVVASMGWRLIISVGGPIKSKS